MSGDEDVVIRMQAEHQATIQALEAVSDAFQRIGHSAEQSGRKQHDGASFAGEGLNELQKAIQGATSAMGLYEQAIDLAEQKQRALVESAKAAKEALTNKTELGGRWQDFLRSGDSVEGVGKQLEQIGAATGAGGQAVQQAAGSVFANRRDRATTGDLLANLQAAFGSTLDPANAASRAESIAKLREAFPQFSAGGAEAELRRHGFSSDFTARELPAMQGLAQATGGRESYQTLAAFTESMGPFANRKGIEKLAEHIESMTGTNSIQGAIGFLGKHPAAINNLNDPQLQKELQTTPEMTEAIRQLATGGDARDVFNRTLVASTPSAGNVAAARAIDAQIAAQPGRRVAQAVRVAAGEEEETLASSPKGILQQGAEDLDKALAARGYMEEGVKLPGILGGNIIGGTSLRARTKKAVEGAISWAGDDPESQRARFSTQLESMGHTAEREGIPAIAREMRELAAAIRSQQNAPKKIEIHDGGDVHRATETPATRAGGAPNR